MDCVSGDTHKIATLITNILELELWYSQHDIHNWVKINLSKLLGFFSILWKTSLRCAEWIVLLCERIIYNSYLSPKPWKECIFQWGQIQSPLTGTVPLHGWVACASQWLQELCWQGGLHPWQGIPSRKGQGVGSRLQKDPWPSRCGNRASGLQPHPVDKHLLQKHQRRQLTTWPQIFQGLQTVWLPVV